jgi:uncharacterized repeat protein (TIGR01451 family)
VTKDTNNLVSQWNDQSARSNHVNQTDVSRQPLWVTNALGGQPVIQFRDDWLVRSGVVGTSLFSNTAATVFIVQKQLGSDSRTTTLSWRTDSDQRWMVHATYDDSIAFQLGQPGSGGSVGVTQPSNWDDTWHVLAVRRDGSNGVIRVDGVSLTQTAVFAANGDSSQTAVLHVGSDVWGNTFNGDIAEIVAYDTALAETNVAFVESQLRSKYSLPFAPAVVPDLSVKNAADSGAAFVGGGVFELDPSASQTRTQSVAALGSASFHVKVQNAGPVTNACTLRAVESAGSGWTVVYRLGSSNITPAIVSTAGFVTASLPPQSNLVIAVEITMTGVVPPGTNKTVTVRSYDSYATNIVRDAVMAMAVAAPDVQPDMMARRDVDAAPVGDNIYNTTGVGQTRWMDVETNLTATYFVTLANDGNTNMLSTLTGTAGGGGWGVKYFRHGLLFDGVNDIVDLGSWTPGVNWSVEAWVKLGSIPGGRRTIIGGANECRDWGVAINEGKFIVPVQPSGGCWVAYADTNTVSTNVWYHLVSTCTGTNASLYVNGILRATGPSGNYLATAYPRIGGEACCGSGYFPGWIKDVRAWNRALDSNEVAVVMTTLLSGNESGLMGWWPLGEGNVGLIRDVTFNGRHGTALNGLAWQRIDATDAVTGPGATNLLIPPGSTMEFVVEVTPDATVASGATNALLVTGTSMIPLKSDTVKLVTSAWRASSTPVSAVFTSTADFEKGRLNGTDAQLVSGQLQLASNSAALPYLWVPNSDNTVSKVDTRNGRELARYRTTRSGVNGNPSRTTVDLRGNCWVANRNCATVVKIGLLENGEFVDRNGDGVIQTSSDLNNDGEITGSEILDWGQDECVLHEVSLVLGSETNRVPGTYPGSYPDNYWNPGPRGMGVDALGNLWAGTHDTMKYYYIDGVSGQILRTIDVAPSNHTAYGAVIDAQGILWSSGYKESGEQNLLRLNPADGSFTKIVLDFNSYGLGLDRNNHLFVSAHQQSLLTRWNTLTGTRDWSRSIGYLGRGVAVTDDGDVWVASSGANIVTRFSNDGVQKSSIAVGSSPTGVTVDSAGKVWVVGNGDEYIRRIDPATDTVDLTKRIAGTHYGYSDMTGMLVRNSTVRLGLWTVVHDGWVPNTAWTSLTWNGSDPTGTNIIVRVRSSNNRASWSGWETAASAVALRSTPPGRYIEIEVTLRGMPGIAAPVLYDLTASGQAPGPTDLGVSLAASPNPVLNQHHATCSVTITNIGTNWASSVWVTNILPASIDVLSISVPGGSYQRSNNVILCLLGGVAPRSSTTITFETEPQLAGALNLTSAIAANEPDANPSNNTNSMILLVNANACVPLPPGTVGWWPGESGANDIAGTNNGSTQGTGLFAAAKVGNGFTFDNNEDRVIIPHNDGMNPSRSGFTVQFWMKGGKDQPGQSESLCTIVEKSHGWADNNGWAFQVTPSSGLVGFAMGNGIDGTWPSVTSGGDVLDGRWHHLAATWDGYTIRFHVDGVLQGTSVLLRPGQNTRPLNFGFTWGNGSPRRFFRGQIDEVSIQNRTLPSSELVAIYESRSTGICTSAPVINQPVVFPEVAIGRSFTQLITAAMGTPPYSFTLASGSLPSGLSLSSGGFITGTPDAAGTNTFTVRVTDVAHQTGQRAFTNVVRACTAPPSGLVGWWSAEDNTDDFVSTNHGTLEYQAGYDIGKVGRAFLLDGNNDAIRLYGSSHSGLDITNNQLSIDLWLNIAATNPPATLYQCIFDKYWDGSANGYGLDLNRDKLEFTVATTDRPGFAITNLSIPFQRWVHVAATYDGAMARVYFDGVEQAAVALTGNILHNNHDACIGNDNWPGSTAYALNGLVDEVEVFNRALSASEVANIYNAGAVGQCVPTPADLLVKNSGESDSAFILNNYYEETPSVAQTKQQVIYPDSTASYSVKIQNDGPVARTFVLRASEIPATNWTAVYRFSGADITPSIHSSTGFVTTLLSPGASQVITLDVIPTLRAPGYSWHSAIVDVHADSRSVTVLDSVQTLTQVQPTYQPDLMIRRDSDITFVGEGVTNSTGVGQTKSIEVEAGSTASYYVQLRNGGNMTNRYSITGASGGSGWAVKYSGGRSCLNLNGSGQYVAVSNAPALRPTSALTLEGWFNFAAIGGSRVLFSKTLESGTDDSYVMWHDGGSLRAGVSGAWNLSYGWSPTLGTWHHIAYTFDDTNNWHVLYLDGAPVSSGAASVSLSFDSHPVLFGADFASENPGEWFAGQMTDLRLWNVVRSQAQIAADMSRRLQGTESGLAGYWRMDEGLGSIAHDSTGTNNGILFNGPTWSASGNSAINRFDVTGEVTGGGLAPIVLAPGATYEMLVEVTPDGSVAGGSTNTVAVSVSSLGGAALPDTVKAVTVVSPASAVPVGGTFTSTADFDKGRSVGVDYVTIPNQLQLSTNSATWPYIWVPNCEGSISKVDTRDGREMARYRTCPSNVNGQPSRTTVDLQGNCWVANRYAGTVVKVGLLDSGRFIDRNGNGLADTSSDLNGDGDITGSEMLPWGQDECVLFEVSLIPGYEGTFVPGTFTGPYQNSWGYPGPRGVAVDDQGNAWVGTYDTKKFYYIDGDTGQILRTIDVSSVNHTSYGAVMDSHGILWSSGNDKNHVLRLDPVTGSFAVVNTGNTVYGLGIDRYDHLFVSGWQQSRLSRINTLTATLEWNKPGLYESRGIAVTDDGDVWVANTSPGTVARWSNDGILKNSIAVGSQPTGVAVDAAGKVWAVGLGEPSIRRIDPATESVDLVKNILCGNNGGYHYGYSDMTGVIARNTTTRMGTWTVIHNAKVLNTPWGVISWLGSEPEGTSIQMRVRSSNNQQTWSRWEIPVNGAALHSTPPGKYLEMEVTLQSASGLTPVLYELMATPSSEASYGVSVYTNNFEGTIAGEWSTNRTSLTPAGARRFLGEFGNQTVTLSLSNLPPHAAATVVFDQFVIRSWDGNNSADGPDLFELNVAGGLKPLHTTFNNAPAGSVASGQAFPGTFPGATNAPISGAAETNTLGFILSGVGEMDSVYHHLHSFPHTSSNLVLNFLASGLSTNLSEESWGLDNVRVYLTPFEGPPVLAPLGMSGGVFYLDLYNEPGWNYVIQGSDDLMDWSNLYTNRPGTNRITLFDPNAPGFTRRFYRAVKGL